MSEENRIGRKIALLLMSTLVLLIILSPISANELDDTVLINQDNIINENIIEVSTDSPDLVNEEIGNSADNLNANLNSDNAQDQCNVNQDKTSNNILGEQDTSNALSSQYTLSDDTFSQYFNAGGTIIENTLKSGDTLIIGNLTNKKMIINTPLNLIGSDDHKITDGYILVERGGANSNITGLKIINTNENIYAIYLRNTENVTVKDCYIVSPNFPMPIVNSNHNNIINNTIDNPITSAHSAIVLGNSHYNNISYNRVQNGANCIYLCIYAYADHKGGESHNNIIMYNNISGAHSVFCYGIAIFGDNNTVMYNNIENTGLGIKTTGDNNTIYFNNLTNNDGGMDLSGTDLTLNNTVDGEMINGNQYVLDIGSLEKETVYVDGANGNDNNPGTKDKPFKTIKAAVNYVNSKEEASYDIIVAEGTYKESDIEIKNHVNLIGKGNVTVDGSKKNNIIILKTFKNLCIKNINFINGKAKKIMNGSAIYSKGNLTLENCTFKNNKAPIGNGGAVYGTYVTISKCQFSSNTASNGGAVFIENDLKIDNSTFTSNKGIDGESSIIACPGALYDSVVLPNKYMNINNCKFNNNKATWIIFTGKGNLTNCSFSKNNGVSILGIRANIDSCNFTANKGETGAIELGEGNVTNSNFNNNRGSDWGGAINIARGTVSNCTFYNNSIYKDPRFGLQYDGDAGAIYCSDQKGVKIENSLFVSNFANSEGGAIAGEKCELINNTFINNTARHYGGALSVKDVTVSNTRFINNSAGVAGGAIATGIAIIENSSFEGNDAPEGKDIFIMSSFMMGDEGNNYKSGYVKLSDDNYYGEISSKEQFLEEKRIVLGTKNSRWRDEIGDEDGNPDTHTVVENYIKVIRYLAPNGWIESENSDNNEGIGNGTGDGIGNGTGSGESGTGDGNDDGTGIGTGTGDGTGDGDGNGTGNGIGTTNGTGTGNRINDLINNLTNAITNDENLTENLKTNTTNNPKTEIKTDAGTYSTNPSPSKGESGSSSSPGESGGHLKAHELEKVKKIDINKDKIYLSILLLLIFFALFLIGFYRRKRDDEENE